MKHLFLIIFSSLVLSSSAQKIHSHNDYCQAVPLLEAFAAGAHSIEADIYLYNNRIVVAHDREELPSAPMFEQLYVKPLENLQKQGKQLDFFLMIDFKTSFAETISPLLKILKKYPSIFNPSSVKVLVSGSRPDKADYVKYPDYIFFDGRPNEIYTRDQLAKIGMISQSLDSYTDWNGKGAIPETELTSLVKDISNTHMLEKPFRLWGSSDNVNTWVTLSSIGVDYINTDKPKVCSDFFATRKKQSFVLQSPIRVYTPSYESDGLNEAPRNIILIIGDGMGLVQLTAAETANRGDLNTLKMKNIGFQSTQSNNSYNTDSAGAGSALATGKKTHNRHISMQPDSVADESVSEILASRGRLIGIVSTGDITDATPAAFYAHNTERNNSEQIAVDFLSSPVSLLVGSNSGAFTNRSDKRNLLNEITDKGYFLTSTIDSIQSVRTVCLDEKFGQYSQPNGDVTSLAKMTRQAIKLLHDNSGDNGFFLMVEAAKIDHAGHANAIANSVTETLRMDLAVSEALQFADADGQTLVIVTGDHETGGLVLLDGDRSRGYIQGYYVSDDHTGVLLPVFAYGPGSQKFRGLYPNTYIPQIITR